MRHINRLVIHCTATSEQAATAAIKNYWKNTLGWKNPGYHMIIERDGSITELAKFDKGVNGAKGFNHDSIHICLLYTSPSPRDRTRSRMPSSA